MDFKIFLLLSIILKIKSSLEPVSNTEVNEVLF